MKPIDLIIIAVIAAILGCVIWYLHKAKKKGVRCISSCPKGLLKYGLMPGKEKKK